MLSSHATEKEETVAIDILIYLCTGFFPPCTLKQFVYVLSDFHIVLYSIFLT